MRFSRPRHARRPRPRPAQVATLCFALVTLAAPAAAAAAASTAAVAVAADAAPQPSARASALTEKLDALIDGAKFLDGAQLSVTVVDVASGARLYSRDPDLPLNPASGIKVVTTASALALLGPEARFSTRVFAEDDAVKGARVQGDVYLVGGGDPLLVIENLYKLADTLYVNGVRRITGGVVVDSSAFDKDGLPPGFDQKSEFASYRAPGGATSVNFNSFVVKLFPGETPGAKTRAEVVPPVPSIKLVNNTSTASGRQDKVVVSPSEKAGVLQLELGGTIGADAGTASYRYPVHDPSRFAGETFRVVLAQRGIKVDRADVRLARRPGKAELLAIHRSRSLSVLIRSVNKLSNNFMAEQVLKLIDTVDGNREPASSAGGVTRVRAHLEGLGIDLAGFTMNNGSGLYDNNKITSAQMTSLLAAVYRDFRYAADFVASLPIAGADGTLRRRLKNTPQARLVRAKTGTLNNVSSLSGYAGPGGARPLAFSILVNGFEKYKIHKVRRLQNELAVVLVEHATPAAGEAR